MDNLNSSTNLVRKVLVFNLPRIQIEIIAELSFLRIFIAWENFLEDSFLRYLVGAESPSGYSPRIRMTFPNMKVAANIIKGERDYVKWNSYNVVVQRSEIYFEDGQPYKDTFISVSEDLNAMNIIRNRIAHKSKYSKEKFSNFVRRTFGHGRRGMTPGRFLLTRKDQTSNITYLEYYVEIIKTVSIQIIR